MFFSKMKSEILALKNKVDNQSGVIEALDHSMASIEFNPDGKIIKANDNFLTVMGYSSHELHGRHHRVFCEEGYAKSREYDEFWQRLASGQFYTGKIKRVTKDGQVVWLEATYNPVKDSAGKVTRVIKFASNVTSQTLIDSENEAKIKAIDGSLATIEFDLGGNILHANENFLNTVGYTIDEVRHKHHRIFCEAEYATKDEYKTFWTDLNEGKPKSGQFKRLHKDGSVVWLEASYTPVYGPDGTPYKIIKFASNITEEMFNREYFNQTLEQATDAVVTIDPSNNVSLFNEAAESLWGYTREEVLGKNVKMLVPEILRSSHDDLVNANRTSGVNKIVGQSREVEIHKKDGKIVWGKLSLSRLEINNEIHYSAFVQDVTEEVVRREEFRRLSLVANETDNSVVITDNDGKIQYVNPGFTKMTGYNAGEVAGLKPGDILQGPETDPETVANIRQALADKIPYYNEILNYHKNGETYWISLAINPVFNAEGELVNFISIQANITETKLKSLEFNYKIDAISRANAVAEFDDRGNIIAANSKYLAVFDVRNEHDLLGKNLKDLLHDEAETNGSFDKVWNKLNAGDFVSGEFKHRDKTGNVKWINGSFNPILDTAGRISKFVMFGEDVTRRKSSIATIASTLAELECGNLTARAGGDFDGELSLLRDSINTSMEKLEITMRDILRVADGITQGANEIARGNLDLSGRVESQAASLEETASTMEEMTASAENNADNARQVNASALETGESANKGSKVVENAVHSMSEISSSSKRIADIITVIDEIAFQTNLLALNAAVEAARAGEQGRGFAVVAGEVRNLAGRSAEAAKEIGALISDSVAKVEEGTRLVNTSGDMLDDITQKVLHVTNMVSQITEATQGQLEGIQQANSAVTSMDQITQQNAALVEQATAASAEMSESISKMRHDLQFFKIS